MNRIARRIIKTMLILVVVAGCVYGGRVEYNDTVCSSISLEKYLYIRDHVGCTSRSEIVDEYMNNKEYYDSIKIIPCE